MRTAVLAAILSVFIITNAVYGFVINKYWNAIGDKYYSISSNFSNPAAITAASGTWNAVGGKVKLYYNFSSNTATNFIQNGKNEVFKLNAGESYLAQTTAYLNSNNKVVEFDIGLNTYVPWGNGDPYLYDVQNAFTHEFGHALYAGDVLFPNDVSSKYPNSYTEVTMYGWMDVGETKKRTLHPDDSDGLIEAYRFY
jgi:hypothetical protein